MLTETQKKRLTKAAREHIEELEAEIDGLEERLAERERAETFDEIRASLWEDIATRRAIRRDIAGAERAWRAARIARIA